MNIRNLLPVGILLITNVVHANWSCENTNGEQIRIWTGADQSMHFQAHIEIDTGSIPGLPQYPQDYMVIGNIDCVTTAADPFLLDCQPNSSLNFQNIRLVGDDDHKSYSISSQVTLQTSYSTTKSLNGSVIETTSQRLIELDFFYYGPSNADTYLSKVIAIPDSEQGYTTGKCSF